MILMMSVKTEVRFYLNCVIIIITHFNILQSLNAMKNKRNPKLITHQ